MGNSSVSKSDQVTRLKALSLECNIPIETGEGHNHIHFTATTAVFFFVAIPEVSFTKNSQLFRVHDGSKDGLAVLLR